MERFGAKLYRGAYDAENNVLVSPVSIMMALSVVAAGSKGKTLDEIVECLHVEDAESLQRMVPKVLKHFEPNYEPKRRRSEPPVITFAQGVWVENNQEIVPTFLELVKEVYKSVVDQADFLNDPEGAREKINSWVSDHTKSLIRELLPVNTVTGQTLMVIANALYFKGRWACPFKEKHTRLGVFYKLNDTKINVPMMSFSKKSEFTMAVVDDFKVMYMPYEGYDSFSMYFLLPNKRGPDGLKELAAKIEDPDIWKKVHGEFETYYGEVELPKFEFTMVLNAKDTLFAMGLKTPFINGQADFSGILKDDRASISEVIHKAVVGVNEVGSFASAATAIVLTMWSDVEEPPVFPKYGDFVANHPFIFAIKSRDLILFIGHVVAP